MCILSVLLKVVAYYDLSVLSMSVMGFQKKVWMGVGGWGEFYPIFLELFYFARPLRDKDGGKSSHRGFHFLKVCNTLQPFGETFFRSTVYSGNIHLFVFFSV